MEGDRELRDCMIGKIVRVTIDRPLGSYHPKFPHIYYSVNYGYVEGIIAGDGEYQDVYILGVNEILNYFEGKVIAIIHRMDDCEDKLVVAPNEMFFSKDEIIKQVLFQEKYFQFEVEV